MSINKITYFLEVMTMKIKVQITTNENMKYFNCDKNTIKEIDFEEYVGIVVASEMGNANEEALKA